MPVPGARIRSLNQCPVRRDGEYVLYWMVAYRRAGWNFALERAAEQARALGRPLLVLEALRAGYPWASERLHAFVLQGMADNRAAFAERGVAYYPYVEPEDGAGKGLLAALAEKACLVVSDDYPCFMIPRLLAAAAARLACRMEAVDANGLLPMRVTPRVFGRAVDFRRFLQKALPEHLAELPAAEPLKKLKALEAPPAAIVRRWPMASDALLAAAPEALSRLPIDHAVKAAPLPGGSTAAEQRLHLFLKEKLARYPEARNQPEADGTSRLSPYLHFGQISVHQVFERLARQEKWTQKKLAKKATAKKEGWWGMSAAAEAFLDELVTWRELGFNFCAHRPDDYDRYESLPGWARETLQEHSGDRREHLYPLEKLEAADTHDALWNAAQRQLAREGWFHGYLRMLWGKKILEWSARPQEALAAMIQLMNKYSLDGRDPNSYSGYFWVLGRYDRPWGPERPIFGAIRYMSSENTARKMSVKGYLARYA